MNMRDWAKREIEIATKREDADNDELDYRRACFESAYKAFECLLGTIIAECLSKLHNLY